MKYLRSHSHTVKWILLVVIISIPTFARMLRPGIYSMQDFPYFRVVEYSKCLQTNVFPCRWAPDAGLGFGEPVFSFYSHVPFFLGALGTQIFGSSIDSLKFVFAFSLFGSAVTMFLLARELWKNNWSAFSSSMLYIYAPYRAVDVWVRGALPEAFAFVLLPLILFSFEKLRYTKKVSWFVSFVLSLSALVLTHNLSVLLFSPLLVVWFVVGLVQSKDKKVLFAVVSASLLALSLSAFYLLPTIAESQYINLSTTTVGYFDFRAHFVTVSQLFISRFWGYGGSTWGQEDGLSLSIGQVQGVVLVLSLILSSLAVIRTKVKRDESFKAFLLSVLALLFLAMTHNKTALLWEELSPVMKYIQFPWRFLGVSLFCISLVSGYLVKNINTKTVIFSAVFFSTLAVVLNTSFFREDIWFKTTDQKMQSGEAWVEQTRASIGDYWPAYGPIPADPADTSQVEIVSPHKLRYIVTNAPEDVVLPVSYFPGWTASQDNNKISTNPNKDGLISFEAHNNGSYTIAFENTPAREWGNGITLFSLMSLLCIYKFYRYQEKK